MVIIKLLKRKDASSVMVAVIGAMVIVQFLSTILLPAAAWISGVNHQIFQTNGYQQQYILPLVTFILEFLGLEILIRGYVAVNQLLNKK